MLKKITRLLLTSIATIIMLTVVVPVIANNYKSNIAIEQKITDNSLELGKTAYKQGRFTEAIEYWQRAITQQETIDKAQTLNYLALAYQKIGDWEKARTSIDSSQTIIGDKPEGLAVGILAQTLNTKGTLQLAKGKGKEALESWERSTILYETINDTVGANGSKINQAKALQSLGFNRRAKELLTQLQTDIETTEDPILKISSLNSLGIVYQKIGNLETSQKLLEESLKITQENNLTEEQSQILFSLGNTARARNNSQEAIDFYQQAAATTKDKLRINEANLNQLSLLVNNEKWEETVPLLKKIESELPELSPSRRSIYAQVNFAQNLLNIHKKNAPIELNNIYISTLLNESLSQSKTIQDWRSQSYTLGTLGHLYEQQDQLSNAQQNTELALNIARDINAPDIAYQWQWQLGRIFQKQGKIKQAIAIESEAVDTLNTIKGDLVAINSDAMYSFTESVEPIYRNLVGLLLDNNPSQENLIKAREVLESLQLAELENYFREACIDAKQQQIDRIDPKAAVVYPIILSDRISTIVSIPNQDLLYYEQKIQQPEIEKTLTRFYQSLNPIFSNKQRLKLSQQIYNWLIEPAETKLQKQGIETLVFVLDGTLRNVPMSALYNGEKYLIENYRVAVTPGLQLLESDKNQRQKLQAVIAGLSQSNQGFTALPGVETEVKDISNIISSQLLLNQEFTKNRLQEQIKQTQSPLVHLATHGQFSSNPEETFIITWNDRVNVTEFGDLLQVREETREAKPIELLVLSACQTAAGDKKAALGLAGVAVRSGARSTLATLWSVKDESTVKLMDKFYQELGDSSVSMTKSEALRQAQISLIHSDNFSHPFFWSPFILVGNWL